MFLFIDSSYIKSQLDIVTCYTVQVTNQWQAIRHCGMWHNSSDQSMTSHWTLWHVTQFKWPISDKPLDIVACDTIQVTNQWQAIGHCGMWHNSSDQSVASHWTLWQCDSLSDQSVTNHWTLWQCDSLSDQSVTSHWTLWQCDSLSDQSVTNLWNLEVDLKKERILWLSRGL
jgi:hypothetical protein